MFQGAAMLNLDAKERLAIPARFREVLNEQGVSSLVLTGHPHRCILVCPPPAWATIRDRLLRASGLEIQTARLKRLLVGHAREETLDANRRVLVAPELRRMASLEKAVWLVGLGDHFELWSDAGWSEQQEAAFADSDEPLPSALADLPL